MNGIGRWLRPRVRGGNTLGAFGQNTAAFEKRDFYRERLVRCVKVLNEAVNLERGMRAEHVFRLREDVFDERPRHDAKRNFPIDPAEGQVVNFVSKGRDVGTLG